MTQFQVGDRVLAVVPDGASEFTVIEGFVTDTHQDGRLVSVRPASVDEWEDGEMHDDPAALSWWWRSDEVFHVVDAESACERCSRMNAVADEVDVDFLSTE